MSYDYREEMKKDIQSAIIEIEEWENATITESFMNKEDAFDHLYDRLWINDSVTGNASGSYTFNAWEAEENICHNLDLLEQAMWEFGCEDVDAIKKGAEWCDVTIRCYLLPEVLTEVIDEIWED